MHWEIEKIRCINKADKSTDGDNVLCHSESQSQNRPLIARTVCNVVNYRLKSVLTLHLTPKGRVIPAVFWVNGEKILVHREYKGDGWLFACKDGHFGFVDSNNVM